MFARSKDRLFVGRPHVRSDGCGVVPSAPSSIVKWKRLEALRLKHPKHVRKLRRGALVIETGHQDIDAATGLQPGQYRNCVQLQLRPHRRERRPPEGPDGVDASGITEPGDDFHISVRAWNEPTKTHAHPRLLVLRKYETSIGAEPEPCFARHAVARGGRRPRIVARDTSERAAVAGPVAVEAHAP
jgi:hypothetical protein